MTLVKLSVFIKKVFNTDVQMYLKAPNAFYDLETVIYVICIFVGYQTGEMTGHIFQAIT